MIMVRLVIGIILLLVSYEATSQATLMHYLRQVEGTADSIIKSHFDSCFFERYITMDIKNAQIIHSQGRFKHWDDLVDSNKIEAYRFFYVITLDTARNLKTEVAVEIDTDHNPVHPRFSQKVKLYKNQQCDLIPYNRIFNIAKENKFKGEPDDWRVFFYFNSPWNDYSREAGFELHIFRFWGGENGKKRYQGHIYDLKNGNLIAKTGGKYTFPLDY